MPETGSVPNFLPSTAGLHFLNYFPHEPELVVHLPLGKTLPIGDAANGLCGGMAFAVRDYFESHQPVPPDTDPPAADSPLYTFIVRRLFDSFNLPLGLNRYIQLMEPAFPNVSQTAFVPSRASVMLTAEWPRIRADLDAGHPVPLGLVKVISHVPHRSVQAPPGPGVRVRPRRTMANSRSTCTTRTTPTTTTYSCD